ncbi:hypothetical protein HG536_0B04170 [Torulaspora globosa]|uniref:Lethal giant larvae (Lgl)-like C-terminal domain-containing protein n=1 Tax=Torulaspora globosa TaxID=48254 RepID=A0A7G3ZDG7_9SACH|nr:uncharacterized protein HG536_0B04170 [Torulaspora globosa]QLL31553.1 hypothetical protein HG536_0B04170 [Torulaspora globosa]
MFKSKRLNVSNPFKSDRSKTTTSTSDSNKASAAKPSKKFSIKDINYGSSYSKLFSVREVSRYGLSGRIVTAAFDFTQSLLAVATDAGEIHVYGQQQVEVVFALDNKVLIKHMTFVKGIYLVVIDSRDAIMIFSLYSKKLLTSVFSPGKIACIESDPSLDWLLIGLQSGITLIYDVDRNQMSNIKIENLQKTRFFPNSRVSPVVSLQWNPRDIGTVLISYELVTVIYSLVEGTIKRDFIYELAPGAPGGEFSIDVNKARRPLVKQSLYHPNSLHIMTVHDDNSMVFWDANSGKLIQARTLFETDVHIPQPAIQKPSISDVPQITKVAWICQSNPEYTSLLVSTGSRQAGQSMAMINLGGTPMYSITSYENMSKYYANTREQKIFPLTTGAPIVNFYPLPRKSPYFSGCHDPGVILILLGDGEIETLLYPSGFFTYKASLFPQSIAWVRPTATISVAATVPKNLWLGMMSAAKADDFLLKGGSPVKKTVRANDIRSALATGHINGSVRIWDASHGELSSSAVFEMNLSHVLNRSTGLEVDHISFATETLELAVSIKAGEVVLFKFEVNQFYKPGQENSDRELQMNFRRFSLNDSKELLVDVRDRSPENVRQGFMPVTAVHAQKGTITAVKNSNVGFVGIAYQEGTLVVIDRRGPAAIFMGNINDMCEASRSWITSMEFVILEYGDDGYSSILLLCGTSMGELITFKILPEAGGRFGVHYMETKKTNVESPILNIDSYSKTTGHSCQATIAQMQDLKNGVVHNGVVIVSSSNDVRSLKVGKSLESRKTFKSPVAASSLSFIPYVEAEGEVKVATVSVNLLASGDIAILSVPDFKEISSLRVPIASRSQFLSGSSILRNGDLIVRTNQSQASLLSIVNEQATGLNKHYDLKSESATDQLYNPGLKIPYRPQVNSLQWARGTMYCTIDQLDKLLGGEYRPQSKFEESIIAKGTLSTKPEEKSSIDSETDYKRPTRSGSRSSRYGVFKSVSRAVENRMDAIEDTFNDYATAMSESVNDVVEQTTKDMAKGAFGL